MALSSTVAVDIAIACICATLILSRCVYRIYHKCKGHAGSHRLWHADDVFMAVALLPLITRTICISLSFSYNPSHTREPPTAEEAAAENMTVERLQHDRTLALQLVVGARLSYALFLWCLKAALLYFYSRFVRVMAWSKIAVTILWWVLALSCIIVLVTILVECRPISLMWKLTSEDLRPTCSDGIVYFIAMAVCNITTDFALLILPFPTLAVTRLNLKTKLQLGVLFGIGILLIVITVVRVPLILNDSMSQKSRSTWATIEILCGCIVANTPFFYGIVRELQHNKGTQPSVTDPSRTGGPYYLQSKGMDQQSYELEPASSMGNTSSRELVTLP